MTAPIRQLGPQSTRIRDTAGQDRPLDGRVARRRRIAMATGAIVLAAAALVWFAGSSWWQASRAVSLASLRVANVERGSFVREVSAGGVVIAPISPTAYAPSDGTVTLMVNPGDIVAAGDVLAVVESPDLASSYAQEQARLQSMTTGMQRRAIEQKQLALRSKQLVDLGRMAQVAARRELRRAEAAWEIKVISRQDLEKAQDDVQKAEVDFEHARAAAALEKESLEFEYRALQLDRERQALVVDELRRRVDGLRVLAPVAGMVGSVSVAQKSAVTQNQPLVSVVDLTAFEVEVSVPQSYGNDLSIGMAASITVGGDSYVGELRAISPQIENNSVAGRIGFRGDMPPGLRQNQRVTVRIELESITDALLLPRGAYMDGGAARYVYVIEDSLAIRRPVETGASNRKVVELVAGVSEGDTVIISSTAAFDDAERVLISQ